MNLEQQVVSLDLAKQMTELGFKQESLFWWIKGKIDREPDDSLIIRMSDEFSLYRGKITPFYYETEFDEEWHSLDLDYEEFESSPLRKKRDAKQEELSSQAISAYTTGELGEMLPEYKAEFHWVCEKENSVWWYSIYKHGWAGEHTEEQLIHGTEKSEADARAKMLIYLKTNNLI